MVVETIKVQTVTPLFTGNAFGDYTGLKPQALLGSLRFWFEVYCLAVGKKVNDYKEEKVSYKKFIETIQAIINQNENLNIFEAKKQVLKELKISVPSQVFGCNGWEGFIKVRDINNVKNEKWKVEVHNICKKKNESKWEKDCSNYKKNYHYWYFPPKYFYGSFNIQFQLMDESLKENILYPLLNFIQKYGFIGAKNNLGFGRVKFELKNENIMNYDVFTYLGDRYNIEQVVEIVEYNQDSFDILLNQSNKITLLKIRTEEKHNKYFFEEIIKELILIKSNKRYEYRKKHPENKRLRHFIFGIRGGKFEEANATKIIPYINQLADTVYEYGFISLILLKNFQVKK